MMTTNDFAGALLATLSEAPEDYASGRALNIADVQNVSIVDPADPRHHLPARLRVRMNDGSEFSIQIARL